MVGYYPPLNNQHRPPPIISTTQKPFNTNIHNSKPYYQTQFQNDWNFETNHIGLSSTSAPYPTYESTFSTNHQNNYNYNQNHNMNQNHHYHQPSVQHSGFLDDSGYSIMPSAVISNDRPTVNHNNPQSPPSRPTPIDYSDDFSYGSFQGRQFFSIALSCTGFLRIRKHRQFFHHDFKYIIWKIFQMFKISFLIFHMF